MRTEIIYSAVTPTLIDASRDAWMIVAGSQGLGALGRLLLGSVTAALLAHAHCPVAVVHTDDHAARAADAPVLVGTDGSPARRPRSPWRSTKRLAGASAWWRYTPGATSACFPFSAWTGATARRRGGAAGRAAGRLAGTVPGRACEAIGRVRQAVSVAGRGSRARSTSRRRQSRTGRVPRHAAGFGQLACRAIGDGAGDRGPWAVTVRRAHRVSGWLLSAPPLPEWPTKVCRPCGWGRKSPDRLRLQT